MDNKSMEKLEYFRIKEQIARYTLSYLGRQHVDRMEPLTDLKSVKRLQEEVWEAVGTVKAGSSVPIPTMEGMQSTLSHIDKGIALTETDVRAVSRFLRSTEQLKQFMARKTDLAPSVAGYAQSLDALTEVRLELDRCVSHSGVTDAASVGLAKVRKKMRIVEDRLKKKLDSTMKKYRSFLQDEIITERSGRTVLSVQRTHKRMVPGVTVDQSSSGQTLFIEPADIVPLQQELMEYRAAEEMEVTFILEGLTNLMRENRGSIDLNIEVIGQYDFLFAKARFAKSVDGRPVYLNTKGIVRVKGGRHPLLGNSAVPLDFSIGERFSVLVITGPNTGGKTVSLKTIGLLTLMVQSGLLVPVNESSEFAVFDQVLADIGDGQSIDASLSTFSAHVKNVIDILKQAGRRTLVLMDELATGTDPGEGIGLSISVLQALHQRGATIVATTHFNEIKQFAGDTAGFENARMEFDMNTLQPLYKLKIGEAGNSYAFEIALKLGMPKEIIERSRLITGINPRATALGGTLDTVRLARREAVSEGEDERSRGRSKPEGERGERNAGYGTDRNGGYGGDRDVGNGADRNGADRNGGGPRVGEKVPATSKVTDSKDEEEEKETASDRKPIQIGDRVWINALKQTGIVYSLPDERGNMTVVVKQKRMTLNHKRVSRYLSREELYPENYDLDIVLESKDDRRKRKLMRKGHVDGLAIQHDKDTPMPKLDGKDRWI